jgi:hypothetical protein
MQQLTAAGDGTLLLVSDLNGVQEQYRFDPSTGRTTRLTASRYGGRDYSREDSTLVFTSQTLNGRMVFRTPLSALQEEAADFAEVHRYPIADRLSEQEQALIAEAGLGEVPCTTEALSCQTGDLDVSPVKSYCKPAHLLKFHSWAPIWFNYDAVSSMSGDFSFNTAAPGLTGFFQNDLGTSSGSVGYAAMPDPDTTTPWRHALHARFTYSGLYPVIEAKLDFNNRGSLQYYYYNVFRGAGVVSPGVTSRVSDQPNLSGSLSAWIPWRFNQGGWLKGFIPRVTWGLTNAQFHTGPIQLYSVGSFYDLTAISRVTGIEEGKNVWMHSVTTSFRAYTMISKASSQTYPRLGAGIEAGFAFRPALTDIFSPTAYAYVYGYLPGLTHVQGLRATLISQWLLGEYSIGESHVNFAPRGFPGAVERAIANENNSQTRLSLDYAIPIYVGDISALSPVAYIRNFLAIPHFDVTFFGGTNLWSAGADLTVELGNLAWFPFSGSFGVELDYLGGSAYNTMKEAELLTSRFYAGLIFSMDI